MFTDIKVNKMSQTLEQIAQRTLESVRVVAGTKHFGKARESIKKAERVAGEMHVDGAEITAFLDTMKEAYGVCFNEAVQEAERYAHLGNVGNAVTYLSISRDFEAGSGMASTERWSQIMAVAYSNGVEFEFQNAERDAKTGYFYGTEESLKKAKEYAFTSKTGFSEERAKQIMATACRNGIELYLNGAEESAKRGDALMWAGQSNISYAENAAKRIGIDITQRVEAVKGLFKK
jgi:hypothetical protein